MKNGTPERVRCAVALSRPTSDHQYVFSGANSRFATQTSSAIGRTTMSANLSTVKIRPRIAEPMPIATPNIIITSTNSTNATGTPTKRTRAEINRTLSSLRMEGSSRAFDRPYEPPAAPVSARPSVGGAQAEQRIGVELPPVGRIAPDAAHALARIQHEAVCGPRPRLGRIHL